MATASDKTRSILRNYEGKDLFVFVVLVIVIGALKPLKLGSLTQIYRSEKDISLISPTSR